MLMLKSKILSFLVLATKTYFGFTRKLIFFLKKMLLFPFGTMKLKKKQKLSDLNIKVEKAVQKFLSIPLVREPSLPPTPNFVKR
jgi:hypothetical protein